MFPDGSNYEGEFENGEYHGFGIYTDSDGETIEGNWIEGEYKEEDNNNISEEEVSLIGTLESVVYSNPENGFLIGTFLEDNTVSPITIKGVIFEVQDQQKLQLKGNWENHPQYGKQFAVREYMTFEPNTREGIERYLASEFSPELVPKPLKGFTRNLVRKPLRSSIRILNNCSKSNVLPVNNSSCQRRLGGSTGFPGSDDLPPWVGNKPGIRSENLRSLRDEQHPSYKK